MSEPSREQGFTLVEMVVSMVILGIILTPLLNFFLTSTRVNVNSWRDTKAVAAAQGIMEEYLTGLPAQLAPEAPNWPSWDSSPVDNDLVYRVTETAFQGAAGLNQVVVEVRQVQEDENKAIKLVTLKWLP